MASDKALSAFAAALLALDAALFAVVFTLDTVEDRLLTVWLRLL